jgi:branched-chain amino acid transport system substrate-binding protein
VSARKIRGLFAKQRLTLVAFALAVLAGCGGSGGSDDPPANGLPKEIVIGAAIAKTGYLAPYDGNVAAIEQLLRETNASGGIYGHKLKIVKVDNRSDPQLAAVAAQQAVEKGADVLLLSCEALTAAAAAPVAEENNELNFTMCASEPGFGPPTTGRLSFSGNPSFLSEVSAGASFLHDRGIKHPFLMCDTSIVMGKAQCSAFEQTWEKLGGSIAGSVDFENGDESIASQVSELKNASADAVVMASYPPGGASAIKQIRAAGIDVPILGGSSFDGTFWLKGIPNTGKIYVTSNGSAYDPPDRAAANLFKTLQRAGVNTDVSGTLLASYAAGQLIIDAIKEAHSVDGNKLADALEAKPHKTIVGIVEYSRNDHLATRTWPVYVYSNGKPKLVAKVKPRFIPQYGG